MQATMLWCTLPPRCLMWQMAAKELALVLVLVLVLVLAPVLLLQVVRALRQRFHQQGVAPSVEQQPLQQRTRRQRQP